MIAIPMYAQRRYMACKALFLSSFSIIGCKISKIFLFTQVNAIKIYNFLLISEFFRTFAAEPSNESVKIMKILWTILVAILPYVAVSAESVFYVHTNDRATTDIFYVCSTETTDWIDAQGDTVHFADMNKPEHRAALYGEMHGVDSLVCPENCNFYAPYYNQATMEGLLRDTALFVPRCTKAVEEVIRAFDYYMQHQNGGRPFVLMGYSQGAFAVVELLKHLTDEQASRMVAAYVIGYQVTATDLQNPHIRAAQSATDTGVTVCYNSVASTDAEIPILSGNTILGINPVNWRTDATPATYVFDYGGARDTLTATLDTVTHLTVIEGYKGACPVIPFVGKKGNYHCLEIPLYYYSLKKNIELRCKQN